MPSGSGSGFLASSAIANACMYAQKLKKSVEVTVKTILVVLLMITGARQLFAPLVMLHLLVRS